MNKKTLVFTGIALIAMLASGILLIDIFTQNRLNKNINENLKSINHYFQEYFGDTFEQIKKGQIVFSAGCTARKFLEDSNVQLPYHLDLKTNIITVSQFVNQPSKFEFRDKDLGFIIDLATWGNFKFKGDTQEFIELSLITTPGAVKLEEGVQAIKEVIQKLEAAGWKRAAGYESSFANLDDQCIEKRIQWDQKSTGSGLNPKLMAWQSKDYQINLHAAVLPDKPTESIQNLNDLQNLKDLKISVELCIKKI